MSQMRETKRMNGQYIAAGMGIIFILLAIKIIVQDDTITTKDVAAVLIGFALGIPLFVGSVIIIKRNKDGI